MNPFPIVGYHSPEYFCDRQSETNAIIQAIMNNRSINLVSIRRLGKTALIRNVFYQLDKTQYVPIFIDLEGTDSLKGFVSRFSAMAGRVMSQLDNNWLQMFVKWASGLGASVSLDPITGMPTLDLSHQPKVEIGSLETLLTAFNQQESKIFVIAFDEFQEVTKYENQNTEGWLRSIMQTYPNLRFIFSGSEKSVMTKVFNDPSRPFFQITQPMQLGYIDREVYQEYILEKLKNWSDKVSENDVMHILHWCRTHTYYVQYFCNILYERLVNELYSSISDIKAEILESQKHFFLAQKNLLSQVQWKTLKAIAKRGSVKNITSAEFLNFSGLASTSARRSVESLLEKGMLLMENDTVMIYNVFLSRYLETLEL